MYSVQNITLTTLEVLGYKISQISSIFLEIFMSVFVTLFYKQVSTLYTKSNYIRIASENKSQCLRLYHTTLIHLHGFLYISYYDFIVQFFSKSTSQIAVKFEFQLITYTAVF